MVAVVSKILNRCSLPSQTAFSRQIFGASRRLCRIHARVAPDLVFGRLAQLLPIAA